MEKLYHKGWFDLTYRGAELTASEFYWWFEAMEKISKFPGFVPLDDLTNEPVEVKGVIICGMAYTMEQLQGVYNRLRRFLEAPSDEYTSATKFECLQRFVFVVNADGTGVDFAKRS